MMTAFSETSRYPIRERGQSGGLPAAAKESARFGRTDPAAATEDRRPRFPQPADDSFPDWVACPGEG